MALYAYNGWLASANPADFGGLEQLAVAGETFAPGVRAGEVHDVLEYLANQLHNRVEPIYKAGWHTADEWAYYFKYSANSSALISVHSTGGAIDYNATRHPNGKRGTFTAAQVAEIRKILAELEGVIYWGGDAWGNGTPDEMHWEIATGVTLAKVRQVAEKIRANGGPTRQLGAYPAAAPAILAAGATLAPGQSLTSGIFKLVMQSDGNAVVYNARTGKPVWSTRTNGHAGARLVMQTDGNLVVYLGSRVLWNSRTNGKGGNRLAMQSDGNLVIYRADNRPVWSIR